MGNRPTGENSTAAIPAKLSALQALLSEILAMLVVDDRLVGLGDEGGSDSINGQIDRAVVEARRLESHAVRVIAELEQATGRIVQPLLSQTQSKPPGGLVTLLGLARKAEPVGPSAEKKAASCLRPLIVETDQLLVGLEDHRAFLQAMLARCEPPLEAALNRLKAASGTPTDGAEEGKALRIASDLLQELADRLIEMLSSFNPLVHKLALDAEERVISLVGLDAVAFEDPSAAVPRLAQLFIQAQRGVISIHAITRRKDRLNDAFRLRLSASRQAAPG